MRLAEAAKVMRGHRYHQLIVKEGGRVVGVLSDSDIARGSASRPTDVRVGDVMSPSVATIDQNETVRRAANLMRGRNVGCLAVMEDGRLCGVVTISDLLTLLGKGVDRRESGVPRPIPSRQNSLAFVFPSVPASTCKPTKI
jgi:CBS domain-containing protein